MSRISVICPTVRTGGIDILLHGLSQQSMKDFELVLCDALWSQRKDIVAQKALDYGVRVIHMEPAENRFPVSSYCRHMNTAFAHSTGDIALLITDYTWLPPDNLQQHLDFHSSNNANHGLMGPHRYTVYPKLRGEFTPYVREEVIKYVEDLRSGRLNDTMFSIFEHPFDVDARHLDEDHSGDVLENGILNVCHDPKIRKPAGNIEFSDLHCKNESVRMEHIIAINGFDEDFDGSHGWQDSEIAWRLTHLRGITWTLNPSMIAQIVNPRPLFPHWVRERDYRTNETIWQTKKATGYPNSVNTWSISEAQKRIANGLDWPDGKKL